MLKKAQRICKIAIGVVGIAVLAVHMYNGEGLWGSINKTLDEFED